MTPGRTVTRTSDSVATSDGVSISVDRYHSNGHETAVIVCPGFFQSKDTKTFRRLAEALTDSRDVLAMDFRGHGRSKGLYTFSAREGADLEAVLRWAQERYRRIGVLGFSLGAAVAMNTAARRVGWIHSLAAISGPSSFEEIEFKFWTPEAMRTGTQGFEAGVGCRPGNLLLKKERPVDAVRRRGPLPVLFVHGTNDVIIGVEHSRRLFAAASEPKQLEIIEGGSHAETLFRDDPTQFTRLLETWFAHTLPGGD